VNTLQLVLWDTAGIERFATLSASYYQSASAAILCYDLGNRDTFNMLSQHLIEMAIHMRTGKIFLCGNKQDLHSSVSEDDVSEFCNQCDTVITKVFRISCKNGEGVREMFNTVAEVLQKDADDRFDPSRIRPCYDHQISEKPKSECC
jgi:small GTP-binding protein